MSPFGSAIERAIGGARSPTSEGVTARPAPPRSFAGYTTPLPLVYGTARVPGIVVYFRDRAAGSVYAKVGSGVYSLVSGYAAAVIFALCEAPAVGITRVWSDKERFVLSVVSDFTGTEADPLFGSGTDGTAVVTETSTAWSYLVGTDAEGMTFEGTVHVYTEKFTLRDGKIPDTTFEVEGLCTATAPWTVDADPSEVVKDLLTHARRGLGLAAADVEVAVGLDGQAASSFARYCTAMGLGVSRAVTDRSQTLDLVGELLDACNSTWIHSEGKFKVVPLDNQSRTGNGVTYTPASDVTSLGVIAIDEDEILHDTDEDPVQLGSIPDADVYNCWPVRIRSRDSDYEETVVEWVEPADAVVRGVRRAETTENRWIATPAHAHKLSTWLAQRSIYSRNTYTFTLGPRWGLLEVGDMIALTESVLGLSAVQCRITVIEDAPDGTRTIEAVEEPSGASAVVDLTPQVDDGFDTPALVQAERAGADMSSVPHGQAFASRAYTALSGTGLEVGDPVWLRGNNRATVALNNGAPVLIDSVWTRSTVYAVGDRMSCDPISAGSYPADTNRDGGGNAAQRIYKCTVAGTSYSSNAGPTGTGSGISDGTCTWDYVESIATAERLKLWCGAVRLVVGSFYRYSFRLEVQPRGAAGDPVLDNLDALTHAELELFTSGSAVTGNMTRAISMPLSRKYYSATHSNTKNGFYVFFDFMDDGTLQRYGSAPYNFNGYARVTVHNVAGSTARDFNATALTTETYADAGGWTLGGVSTPAPDGGGADEEPFCPAPETLIRTPSGWAPAGAILPGQVLWSVPEGQRTWGHYPVSAVAKRDISPRVSVVLRDGRSFLVSPGHRFLTRTGFRSATELRPGDRMVGSIPGLFARLDAAPPGPVVRITVADAHTYDMGGVLVHNAKPLFGG